MGAALVATLARPSWWAMALAAFLVRGGFFLILLPVVSLPTTAGVATAIAPTLQELVLGRQTIEGVAVGAVALVLLLAGLAAAALAGSWLDLALVRAAATDEDVELGWAPHHGSVREALAIRLAAHLPTLIALGYAFVRLVSVAYEELTAPGVTTLPVVARVVARAPEALLFPLIAWLAGETVGSLAARRSAAGMRSAPALLVSARQVLGRRGMATLLATSGVVIGVWVPYLLAASAAWSHLRAYLLDGATDVQLAAALVLFVATWVLGLAVGGAALALRATAWTAEVAPPEVATDATAATASEIATGTARG
jgi:hypothetical protein